MDKILDTPCRKCGGDTHVKWYEDKGLIKKCYRCHYEQKVKALDEE